MNERQKSIVKTEPKPKAIIIGGGFGGLSAAKSLASELVGIDA